MIPRAHGAWVMFAAPFVVAAGVAGRFDLPAGLLLTAGLALFLADAPLLALVRGRQRGRAIRWATAYGLVGIAASSVLLVHYRLLILIPFGLFGLAVMGVRLFQASVRADRSAGAELLSLAGFSASAPATYAVLTGYLDLTALLLWALHALFFGSSVFYVKMRVQTVAHRRRPGMHHQEDESDFGRATVCYHAALALLVSVLAVAGHLPALAALAFAPVVFRALWAVARRPDDLRLWRVGAAETGYALTFVALVVMAFRIQ
ncbi:YwiC-like family protein [bacterium]|nr:YwiC-like family protein [bacterium]